MANGLEGAQIGVLACVRFPAADRAVATGGGESIHARDPV